MNALFFVFVIFTILLFFALVLPDDEEGYVAILVLYFVFSLAGTIYFGTIDFSDTGLNTSNQTIETQNFTAQTKPTIHIPINYSILQKICMDDEVKCLQLTLKNTKFYSATCESNIEFKITPEDVVYFYSLSNFTKKSFEPGEELKALLLLRTEHINPNTTIHFYCKDNAWIQKP